MSNPSKKVIINADDFGESAAVDAAIINLAQRRIIHSTSALVLSPHWPVSANQLKNLNIQVGLHLDFTSRFTVEFGCQYHLPALILAAYCRLLNFKKIENAIELQWARFIEAYGKAPDFIDGHQHVHQLPVVRDALFAVIRKKAWGQEAGQWLRVCQPVHWRGLKAGLISSLGAQTTRNLAMQARIRTNSDFAGVYNLEAEEPLPALWQQWLASASGDMPLIMCHVAIPHLTSQQSHPSHPIHTDAIYPARVAEYQWLSSRGFQALKQTKTS